jgi:hypothetical protein
MSNPNPGVGFDLTGFGFPNQVSLFAQSFLGLNFIITSKGIFFYSGTPALGNLVISLVPPGTTTDQFGNVVLPDGLTMYTPGGQTTFLGNASGINLLKFFTNDVLEILPGEIVAAIEGTGITRFITTAYEGPGINVVGHTDTVGMFLNSPNAGGTSFANGSLPWFDNAGGTHPRIIWDGDSARTSPADGNTYSLGHLIYSLASNLPLNSTSLVQILPGITLLAGKSYRIHGVIEGLQGATAAAQTIQFVGPTVQSPTRVFYKYIQDGLAQSYSNVTNLSTLSAMPSPAYTAARTFYFEYDCIVTALATGVVAIFGAEGTNGDPWTAISGSYIEYETI